MTPLFQIGDVVRFNGLPAISPLAKPGIVKKQLNAHGQWRYVVSLPGDRDVYDVPEDRLILVREYTSE